jgi:hypothetical protein
MRFWLKRDLDLFDFGCDVTDSGPFHNWWRLGYNERIVG